MGISIIGGATAAAVKVLNKSQVFTTSGTWTAPAGVTYAHVQLRGGNGTFAGFYFGQDYGSNNGADGGTTSAFSKNALGSLGSRSSRGVTNSGYQGASAEGSPANMSFYNEVTPGTTYTITVGSGTGAFAVVSWAE
jgi:hypothetical protein